MHPHGVFYKKDSEGASYNDGIPDSQKKGSAVPPGETYTYVWEIPERAGPGPADPSSLVWLYHSHVYEPKDVNSGLVGAILFYSAAARAGAPLVTPSSAMVARIASNALSISARPSRPMQPMRKLSATVSLPG